MRITSSSITSTALLLALVVGSALAGDGDRRGGNRDDLREPGQSARQESVRDAQERVRDTGAMQSSQQRQQMQPQSPQESQHQSQQPPSDNGRRGGRMSPEDRRALRRQIDQASHDMYGPGR